MKLEQLRTLRDRVAKLTGPDREVDYLTAITVLPNRYAPYDGIPGEKNGGWAVGLNEQGKPFETSRVPHYTASIDAVEALRQRVLPGKRFIVIKTDTETAVCFQRGEEFGHWEPECIAPTEPLARLLALLDALIAQGENHD